MTHPTCSQNTGSNPKIIKDNYLEYDGFVIIHGTDMVYYTASTLSFLLQDLSKLIVLMDSQVPPHMLGSDPKRNILDSVRMPQKQISARQ